VKLTIVGGGGFRVPLVYGALLEEAGRVSEIVLHDVDQARLDRIAGVLDALADEHAQRLPFRATTDLDDAIEGADFVFTAIRVGKLEGRVADEDVPLSLGVIGQETVGAGGITFALRTIPVMLEIALTVARRAPNAWLVNFTNPAGMVTEALRQVLGDRVIGICDSPSGLCRRVARALGRDPDELWFDYFGLNHLGWLRAVRDPEDLLPALLADDERLASFEEGRLFGAAWLRSLGMIPNEYLAYFYFGDAHPGRGAFLLEQQRAFYESHSEPLAAWRAAHEERDRTYMGRGSTNTAGGYEREALKVLRAIAGDTRAVLILNTANRSSLPFLDADAVVEVPCVVGRAGAVPVAIGDVPDHARALIETIKAVERATIEAALHNSRDLAIRALALHPLVGSVTTARAIVDAHKLP
jgi:6-phospho-beta-glucosidase